MVLRWGGAVLSGIRDQGWRDWLENGSFTEGNVPSNYAASNHGPLFSEEITIDYLIP